MVEYDKPFGIFFNRMTFQGNVVADPQIVGEGDNRAAYLSVETYVPLIGADGSWSEKRIDVPAVATDQKKVNTIEKYVKAKRQVMIEGYYQSWDDGSGGIAHGIIITTIKLGNKNDFDNAP
jgi:single-stranded DNA-binding protein